LLKAYGFRPNTVAELKSFIAVSWLVAIHCLNSCQNSEVTLLGIVRNNL